MPPPEWMAWLRASREGDSEAFGWLVDRFKDSIFALCYGYVRRFHEAEDLAQEVFVRAFIGLERLQDLEKFPNWLNGISSNVCIDWLRKRKPEFVSLESVQPPETPDSALSLSIQQDKRHQARELDGAIRDLPLEGRQAVLLRYFGSLSYREIAEVLGVPVSTVRGQLYRATRSLRKRLFKTREETP